MKKKPHFHREIPLGTSVRIPQGPVSDRERVGTVVGIAHENVMFIYIVLLNEGSEVVDDYGVHRAINLPGTMLLEMDGTPFLISSSEGSISPISLKRISSLSSDLFLNRSRSFWKSWGATRGTTEIWP
jgi:hypothetical protein